jgi:hypothetical protein
MAAGAIGTDTGGSIRIPSALNGLVGFKPTAKRVPLDDVLPLSFTLDSAGRAHVVRAYGLSWHNELRNAATYVDRILRGDKPADLPVQTASKFETALNPKAAKELGFAVSGGLLVAADEVIE